MVEEAREVFQLYILHLAQDAKLRLGAGREGYSLEGPPKNGASHCFILIVMPGTTFCPTGRQKAELISL